MYKNYKFLSRFSSRDQEKLTAFFNDFDSMQLNKKDLKKMYADFEKGILYYFSCNKRIPYILKLLSTDKLIDGYQNSNKWYPLDNSSKIYPLSMQYDSMSIYRISYYLENDIIPEIMQLALDYTMIRFPLFKTSIHKGFFWNYLDSINKHFDIFPENNIPCSKINISKFGTQLFRVLYYQNRISCEIFHVLTDANGGLIFLTTLVSDYLRLLGKKIQYDDLALNILDDANGEEVTDEFLKANFTKESGNLVESKALCIDGKLSLIRPCQIIDFDLDYNKLHTLAHEKDASINELLLAFLFLVLSYSTSKNGDIKIQVPVNMRKFYPTKSLRNFSLYYNISIPKKEISDLNSLLNMVKEKSRAKLQKEKLDGLMYHAYKLVKSLNYIPLFIKSPIARFIYNYFGDKSNTTVLSNLGKVSINSSLKPHILKADFLLGSTVSNRILFSCITVNTITTLSITKFTTNSAVENNLYNLLKEYHLIKEVHGSDKYEIKK